MLHDELKRLSQKRAAAIELENALTDIFDHIKITHHLALNFDSQSPISIYGDDEEALISSVHLLREAMAAFQNLYYGSDEVKI